MVQINFDKETMKGEFRGIKFSIINENKVEYDTSNEKTYIFNVNIINENDVTIKTIEIHAYDIFENALDDIIFLTKDSINELVDNNLVGDNYFCKSIAWC